MTVALKQSHSDETRDRWSVPTDPMVSMSLLVLCGKRKTEAINDASFGVWCLSYLSLSKRLLFVHVIGLITDAADDYFMNMTQLILAGLCSLCLVPFNLRTTNRGRVLFQSGLPKVKNRYKNCKPD